MKYLLFSLSVLLFHVEVFSQQIVVDSFIVMTKYVYQVTDGVPSDNAVAEYQETYNRQSQIIRKIYFSPVSFQPEVITYYHYLNSRPVYKEHINSKNELISFTQLKYKKDLLIEIDSVYKDNKGNKNQYQVKIKRKKNTVTESHYLNDQLSLKVTNIFRNDSLIEQSKSFLNGSDTLSIVTRNKYLNSRMNSQQRIVILKGNTADTATCSFKYNDSGKLVELVKQSHNSKEKTIFTYYQNGNLESINSTNKEGKYLESILFKYLVTDIALQTRSLPDVSKF